MSFDRSVIDIRWSCVACEQTNDLSAPVWDDIYGEYVVVECPDCLTTVYVGLEAANA